MTTPRLRRVVEYLGLAVPENGRPRRGLGTLGPVANAVGADDLVVIVVFAPTGSAAVAVREAAARAGAGAIGEYRACSFSARGEGRFEPVGAARPTIGQVGVPELVEEQRIEVVCRRRLAGVALRAMLAAHPYEEPAHHVYATIRPQDL